MSGAVPAEAALSRRNLLRGKLDGGPAVAGWQDMAGAPTVPGDVLWAVHACGETLFVGGDEGTILQFDGALWRRSRLSARVPVHAIAGDPETGLLAVGWMGAVWRFDGTDWRLERGCEVGADGKYAACAENTPLFGLAADGEGRFWAVGDEGTILHFDGEGWHAEASGTRFHLRAVTMLGDGRVLAAGANGTVLIRGHDGAWSAGDCPVATTIHSALALAPDDVLLAGGRYFLDAGGFRGDLLRWDGKGFRKLDPGPGVTRLRALAALSGGALAVGDRGQSFRIAGERVTRLADGTSHDLLGLAVTASGAAVAAGDFGTLLAGDGATAPAPVVRTRPAPCWDRMTTGTDRQIWAVWQHPETGTAYACGEEGLVLRREGDGWEALPPVGTLGLHALAASEDGGVLAAGQMGEIHHFDGTRWRRHFDLKLDVTILALWSDGAGTMIAAGDEGLVLRWTGESWTRMVSGTQSALYALWGPDPEHLLAVGDSGLVLRWNGRNWQEFTCGSEAFLFGVWGTGLDNIFVTGLSGTIRHFDGQGWQAAPTRMRNDLLAISGKGAEAVAVGTAGAALRHDGKAWRSEPTGFDGGLRAVSATGPAILAAGDGGAILRRRGSWGAP
ncbi:hypothetical protein M2324_002401 [Rhodovulum sulfidophilum]|uniref:hypothetical protein n=1 Tax=Rhodovulum sulfidophilum TaxID=35806 RepID=UPI0005A968F6|nr:hypothetical protein [Rhodovulum sulfidophilum]ANB33883.1 glycosyl hydrolase [Rhodovulum sulfidophilum DSM 1374]ANB37705.1 glycosyl hydrolase [Rhodovulum sulfidophilum]MCW2303996.1 hypothetical protein [Rhodovulum sulfidophilum]